MVGRQGHLEVEYNHMTKMLTQLLDLKKHEPHTFFSKKKKKKKMLLLESIEVKHQDGLTEVNITQKES
jgi:hypothetical protein